MTNANRNILITTEIIFSANADEPSSKLMKCPRSQAQSSRVTAVEKNIGEPQIWFSNPTTGNPQ